VLAQSPTANEAQVAAPKISLLVTAETDPEAFVMPSFVGQSLGNASRSLQDAGFKLGNVGVAAAASSVASDTSNLGNPAAPVLPAQPSPASVIVSQVPGAGQKVVAGAAVNFEVR
jgi:beta-lactam-binding protein with PASTA domain